MRAQSGPTELYTENVILDMMLCFIRTVVSNPVEPLCCTTFRPRKSRSHWKGDETTSRMIMERSNNRSFVLVRLPSFAVSHETWEEVGWNGRKKGDQQIGPNYSPTSNGPPTNPNDEWWSWSAFISFLWIRKPTLLHWHNVTDPSAQAMLPNIRHIVCT